MKIRSSECVRDDGPTIFQPCLINLNVFGHLSVGLDKPKTISLIVPCSCVEFFLLVYQLIPLTTHTVLDWGGRDLVRGGLERGDCHSGCLSKHRHIVEESPTTNQALKPSRHQT